MAALAGADPTPADPGVPIGVRAEVRPLSYNVPTGQPVWVRFSLENATDQPVTLSVPGTKPDIPSPYAGLPLPHVFNGGSPSAVTVTTPANRRLDQPIGYHKPADAPLLMIAGRSTVGVTLDLREYFPVMRGAGQYRIDWNPYGSAAAGTSTVVTIGPLKRAEIVTDDGTMTVRFFYTDAPKTVANFIELAATNHYSNLTFHRIEPGYLIQGGCPRGDGTGIRLDGKRVPAEFNSHAMQKGTLAMALLDDDPDSASCQFFICNTRQKEWDGKYAAFADLVGDESFATLDRLMAKPVDDLGRPKQTIRIRSIHLIDAPQEDFP